MDETKLAADEAQARLASLEQAKDLFGELEQLFEDQLSVGVLDEEMACSAIAETNACGFYVDEVSCLTVSRTSEAVVAKFHWHATGDQDPDAMYGGHKIEGEAVMTLSAAGLVLSDVTAEVVDDYSVEHDIPDPPEDY